jgi:hypothetical protein
MKEGDMNVVPWTMSTSSTSIVINPLKTEGILRTFQKVINSPKRGTI